MKIHLLSANSKNKFGLEYFVSKAFKKLGYEVIETDYRVMSKEEVDARIRFITDVDFLLMIKGERVSPDSLFSCRIPKILWMQDSIQSNQEANFVIQTKSWAFDLVYTFNDIELPFYLNFNKNVKWLPLAADEDIHIKKDVEKNISVSFVGSMNNNRVAMINYLLDHGCPVELFYTKEKYCDIVNRSVINLNIGINNSGIQQRVFETLAMGGLLLTNKIEGNMIFEDCKHLVYFENFDQLLFNIQYYIRAHDFRNEISKQGREEVLKNHTYVNRVQTIINDFKQLG